jgi:hypothetical protein
MRRIVTGPAAGSTEVGSAPIQFWEGIGPLRTKVVLSAIVMPIEPMGVLRPVGQVSFEDRLSCLPDESLVVMAVHQTRSRW